MPGCASVCAVVPVQGHRQRQAAPGGGAHRGAAAGASRSRCCADVLQTLAAVDELAGVLVVTTDPAAAALAAQAGAQVSSDHAGEGHTGAVIGAVSGLLARGLGLMTVPGDIPLVTPDDIRRLLAAHASARRLHDRAGAGRDGLQRGAVHAGRCGAAALRRQQLLPASRRRQGARHRAARRAAAAHRPRHRHAGGSGAVPGDAVGNRFACACSIAGDCAPMRS